MFIIVKYGQNETLLCNPMCAIINLLNSIKKRAGYGNSNVIVDLSDETGIALFSYTYCYSCIFWCCNSRVVLSEVVRIEVWYTRKRFPYMQMYMPEYFSCHGGEYNFIYIFEKFYVSWWHIIRLKFPNYNRHEDIIIRWDVGTLWKSPTITSVYDNRVFF